MDSTPGKLKLNDGSTKSARGSKKAGGRSKRNESENTIISKSMSYILRHGAEKEGLKMRADGFVRVEDLVSKGFCDSEQWPHYNHHVVITTKAKETEL